MRPSVSRMLPVLVCLGVLAGCGSSGSAAPVAARHTPSPGGGSPVSDPPAATRAGVALPPVHGRFSYQIGGAFPASAGVGIVDRDHADAPDPARFSICYVNAFQAQPDAVAWWSTTHPDTLLRDSAGRLVLDTQWDEPLFDISTGARRAELMTVIGGWIDGCAARGYRAVEADNLDSYTRSGGRLSQAQALLLGRLLVQRAHRDGLSIGQKNAADLSGQARQAGFDFAIAEECQVYAECDSYRAAYGAHLIEIEYTDQPAAAFSTACRLRGAAVSIVLRDRDVTPAGDPHFVERWCR
jgi:hypothetical protein